ncbi:hypothetical protein D3C85_1366280 [compost metagenome]
MVLISPLPFEVLSGALQALSQMTWGGQTGLLRYYDSRIFPLLMSSILTDAQRAEFLQVATYWGWLDRDKQPQWLPGTGQPHQGDIDVRPLRELDDQQFDRLGCISEAQQLLHGKNFEFLDESPERRFALLYSLALQASEENHFGELADYVKRKSGASVVLA